MDTITVGQPRIDKRHRICAASTHSGSMSESVDTFGNAPTTIGR
jgi:hypothetical protein